MSCLELRTSLSPWPERCGGAQRDKALMPRYSQAPQCRARALQPDLAPAGVVAGTDTGADGAIWHGTRRISPACSPDTPRPYRSDTPRSTSPGGCSWRSRSASRWGRWVSAARRCGGQTHSLGVECEGHSWGHSLACTATHNMCCPSIRTSIHPNIHPFTHPSIHPSTHPPILIPVLSQEPRRPASVSKPVTPTHPPEPKPRVQPHWTPFLLDREGSPLPGGSSPTPEEASCPLPRGLVPWCCWPLRLTCVPDELSGLGLSEGGDLGGPGMAAGLLEAPEGHILAVDDTVGQRLCQALLVLLQGRSRLGPS